MPRAKKTPASRIPLDATKHPTDTRTNIPTAELESFAEDEERKPTTLLYPRDPSLDPQLVWKGKDEQDRADLDVPAVPIYIQETIEPRALIEDLRAQSKRERPDEQVSFFDSFEGMEFADRVDFYQHQGRWTNRMILGDSLLVMASLAEKEGLRGQVQMIYLDPPYGIKFGSNWQVSTRRRDVRDGKAEDATRQPEQIRAFRDTWELGVHSYLSYLRDRLMICRDLLTESGSIFVQIGDENVHLVRAVLDEVFGSNCGVVTVLIKKKGSQRSGLLDPVNDYLLWYSKSPRDSTVAKVKYRPLLEEWVLNSETLDEFDRLELPDGTEYPVSSIPGPDGDPRDYRSMPSRLLRDHPGARLFRANPLTSGGERTNQSLPFTYKGITYSPGAGNSWKHTARPVGTDPLSGMERLGIAGRLIAGKGQLRFKSYLDDVGFRPLSNWWDRLGGAKDQVYAVQTNPEIVQRCVLMTTDPGDLVLDPTCGSGTSAFVAEHWGRRWITIDTSRVALALSRTRLMSARYPYYLLADSPEGYLKESEIAGLPADSPPSSFGGDIKRGFVYRRVRHVTSTTIANATEICEGISRAEIDAAVARHADTEVLRDRPYADSKVVRVSGPFTVESLSPHRVLTPVEDGGQNRPTRAADASGFIQHVIENLRTAGIQNTIRGERLMFDRIEPRQGGVFVQVEGDYREKGQTRTVAVCIGPEHGTVGPELVRDAAKEAVRFADLLVICGFAFEALVEDESSRLGRLTILKARINPDLQMPDLLKKTGAANLFMVFGEPDVEVRIDVDDQVMVEVRGVDVYDPTTGVIRSNSTDDIASWFIDTNYNGECFFVRQAYFPGADDPYRKLRLALRAEIEEASWRSLVGVLSRPFPKPVTGKIAIKVINHYGDEVLKVYKVTGDSDNQPASAMPPEGIRKSS